MCTEDLQVDWRVGAEFFESQLIDHEVRPTPRARVLTLAALCQLRELAVRLWRRERPSRVASVQPDQAGQRL